MRIDDNVGFDDNTTAPTKTTSDHRLYIPPSTQTVSSKKANRKPLSPYDLSPIFPMRYTMQRAFDISRQLIEKRVCVFCVAINRHMPLSSMHNCQLHKYPCFLCHSPTCRERKCGFNTLKAKNICFKCFLPLDIDHKDNNGHIKCLYLSNSPMKFIVYIIYHDRNLRTQFINDVCGNHQLNKMSYSEFRQHVLFSDDSIQLTYKVMCFWAEKNEPVMCAML